MEKFTLELLCQIIGIGSASGLIYKDNTLLVIGDNSGFLYEYTINSKNLKRIPLVEQPLENTPKKDKNDFEAITCFQDQIYVFGSGSTENRNKMIQIDATTKQVVNTTNLEDIYLAMQHFGKIKSEDFNLEGAIFDGERWFLFNRGNGEKTKNVVFTINGKNLSNNYSIVSTDFKLPKIKGVRTSFTDAILVDDKIYFLASAEDTTSTYDDGEVLGSIIGSIEINTMKIDFTKTITKTKKLEGITLYQKSEDQIEFLVCEDNDTEELVSSIYKLKIDISE